MSKKPNMRWLKRDEERVNKLVKNFNAKLTRMERKGVGADMYLPKRISRAFIKDKILTRDDFNFIMDTYEGFTKRGAEKPAEGEYSEFTKWAYEVHEKVYKPKVNKEKKIRREKILAHPQYSRGQKTGVTLGELYTGRAGMHDIREVQLRPVTRDLAKMNAKKFQESLDRMEREMLDKGSADKAEVFKENYLKAMIREGFSDEIRDLVSGVPARVMGDIVMFDTEATIDFIYDKTQLQTKTEALRKVWTKAMGREKISKNEWDVFFSRRKYSMDELADMFGEMNLSDAKIKTWRERLENYGYSVDEIAAIFGYEEENEEETK